MNQLIESIKGPKAPKSSLRPRQDGPKAPQDRPKRAQESPKAAQNPPKTAQEPTRSPLGTVLEPSWDHQSARSKSRPSGVNRWKHFWSILELQMPPKTTPRRPQNESKIKTKNASTFYRSGTRLGPVLRRSWALLGVKKMVSALVLQWFREHRIFFEKITL